MYLPPLKSYQFERAARFAWDQVGKKKPVAQSKDMTGFLPVRSRFLRDCGNSATMDPGTTRQDAPRLGRRRNVAPTSAALRQPDLDEARLNVGYIGAEMEAAPVRTGAISRGTP
ncbi:MAG: hypothetical protein ACR65U_05670 [Methylocystis sp.]